jgi:endonuclease/exonuclease/phosphatase family metal-dependent hydrolase
MMYNKIQLAKFLLLVFSLPFGFSATAQPLEVMTFNIRYNNPSDSLDAWPFRRDKLASEVRFHGVDLALHDQVLDLKDMLPKFRYLGIGREDGKTKGEYSAIFYDTTVLSPLKSATFWLSETPSVPGSKGWDAAITRIVTWAEFIDKRTNKTFFAFNTHFDHIGTNARRQSALLVLRKVKEIAGNQPVVLTGDFNARPTDEPIRVITDPANPLRLQDSRELSETPHYGPTGTFNGFKPKEIDDQPIDYIFLRNRWTVLRHATISQSWNGHFASDHFAVLATLVL